MRVLVTGGLGFVGHHVSRALLARGDEVTILDARTEPVHDPADPRPVPDAARFVEGSILESAILDDAMRGVDAVVHLAAYQDYHPDPARYDEVNTSGTQLVLARMREVAPDADCFVYASSQAVYGEGAVACERDGVSPTAPRADVHLAAGDFDARCSACGRLARPAPPPESMTAPLNPYGVSKLAGEHALDRAGDVRTVSLRYAIIHGSWQSPRNAYSGILRAACVRALEGKRPVVFEDGQSLRDYVAIEDVVAATLLALDDDRAEGAYNVGGPRSWSVLELLDAVGAATGLNLAAEVPGWYRVGDVRHTIGDLTRLRALGWEPSTDLAQTWRDYVAWLQEHRPPQGTVDRALEAMRANGTLRVVSAGS